MMMVMWMSFSYFTTFFFKFMKKKLVTILSLEGVMMMNIFFMYKYFTCGENSYFLTITMMIFMVLDSIMGITILVSSSRNSMFPESFLSKI